MAVNTGAERRRKTSYQYQGERPDSDLPLTYTIEFEIDLVKPDPKYPKDPKTLGEHIRKTRMDQHMMVKELAERVGVVPETVINWEKRNLKPASRYWERLRAVIGLDGEIAGSSQGDCQSQS